MFKRNYHVVFFVSKEDNCYFSSSNIIIKGKFDVKEVQEYLEETRGSKNIVILNWIKL